jgi:hypothetical protein
VLGVAQSIITAVIVILALRFFNSRLHVKPEMVSALALVLCAMPGLALYRISTAVSRGMKVMQHDIYSRGITEPIVTTLAFLLAGHRGVQGVLTGGSCGRWVGSLGTYRTGARLNIVSSCSRADGCCIPFSRSTLFGRICCSDQHLSAD